MKRKNSLMDKNLPIIRDRLKRLGKKALHVMKTLMIHVRLFCHKAKPHVITAAKRVVALARKAYHHARPLAKKAYREAKPRIRKAYHYSKPKMQKGYAHVKARTGHALLKMKKRKDPVYVHNGQGKRDNALLLNAKRFAIPVIGVVAVTVLVCFLMSMSDDKTPEGAVAYKFPEGRSFSYPKETPVECPEGMESDCGEGFFEPKEEGCPISCDDDDPCTTDECSADSGYECVNTEVDGCAI